MNSLPEDIIGFKLLNINEMDIEFSKQKEQYEMNWELEYLKKKMKEKLKKVDKIVRNELDDEHYSDNDSVDLTRDENQDNKVSEFVSGFKSIYERYPTKEEVEDNLEMKISEDRLNYEIRKNDIRDNEIRNIDLIKTNTRITRINDDILSKEIIGNIENV